MARRAQSYLPYNLRFGMQRLEEQQRILLVAEGTLLKKIAVLKVVRWAFNCLPVFFSGSGTFKEQRLWGIFDSADIDYHKRKPGYN